MSSSSSLALLQAEGLSTDSGVTGHVHAPRQVSYTPSEEPTDVSPKPKKLSPNAAKLLGYLRGALSTKEARSLTKCAASLVQVS